MTKVLNLKDSNYTIPKGAVYVGRASSRYHLLGSKWSNPFKIGQYYGGGGKAMTREDTIKIHRAWLLNSDFGQTLLSDIQELKGKDLVCWCAPLPCHADILLELANKGIKGGS